MESSTAWWRRPLVLGLLGIQILSSTAFFLPQHHGLKSMPPVSYRQARPARMRVAALRMLKEPQGSDAFARVIEKDKGLSPLHKLSAGPAKALKLTTIPLGAAVGFVATPLASPVLRACGALFAGVAAKVANDRLRSMREDGAEVAVAQMLLDYGNDLGSLTPMAIKSITAQYDVEYATHLKIVARMYTDYLLATLDWPEVRMEEPSSLIDLSAALGLDSATIGDSHCAAAEEIAKRLMEVPFDEQEDAWEQRMVNKLLFLSNRVFSQLEEEETREYELGRIEEILGLSAKEGNDRVQGLVFPFYRNILKAGIDTIRTGKGIPLDSDKLAQWRKSLGVTDAQAAKLHSQAFSGEVQRCVEAGAGRLRDEHMDALDKVRGLLTIPMFSADRALETVTAPLLRASIVNMLTSLTTSEPDTWPDALHQVRQRQKELRMVDSALVFHIKDVYKERLRGLIREATSMIDVVKEAEEGEEEKAAREVKLRNLIGASLLLRRLMQQFCEVNNLDEVMDEDLGDIAFLKFLPGELGFGQRDMVFRRYVKALVNAKLIDEEASSINELGEFFELEPKLVQSIVRSLVGPIYEARVRQYVETNQLTDSNKADMLKIIKDFRVAESEVRSIGMGLYEEKAKRLFGDKKSFSTEDLKSLGELKAFLLLSESDVDRVHEPLAREEFLRVVREEFAKQKTPDNGSPVSSFIPEAAQAKIRETAAMLGLSDDARDDLLGEALTGNLDPQLENLKTQYRRVTMTAEEKKEAGGKDEGEDPFIRGGNKGKDGLMIKTDRNSNLMVDAVNIVKFLEDNDGFRETQLRLDDESHMIKAKDERPKRMVQQFICKASTRAFSGEEDDSKLAEEIYKAFVQTVARAPEGDKKDRYRVVQDKFGAVLGIHPPRMESIKFELYAESMRKLVRGCLEAKGMLGPDDVAELQRLNRDYCVTEDRADRLVQTEKRKWLAGNLVGIITSPPNVIGPVISRLRTAAASMAVDLSEDMPELTTGNREFLFTKELSWLLETPEEDADSETVSDLMEQFGVEEDNAQEIIKREFKEATRQVAVDLIGNMNRGTAMGAFKDLGKLIRIGNMVPLPLDFGPEAFLGMAVCADIMKLWKSYSTLLKEGATQGGSDVLDLKGLITGLSEDEIKALKAQYEEDDKIVQQLIHGLEALPASQDDINLAINYRGKKVDRKQPKAEDMADSKEEWEAGQIQLKEYTDDGVVIGPDGRPMTVIDIVKKAIETRSTYMGPAKRKSRVANKEDGGPPKSSTGRRAA